MVQQYNERIEQARLELARWCRENSLQLMRNGYKGRVNLGYSGVTVYYMLADEHLFKVSEHSERRHILSRAPTWERVTEREEITADEIPFENYKADRLLEIATNIEKAQKSLTPSPM